MSNPVLVEVTRGKVVESRHRGSVCVIDGDGRTVLSIGDVERPVFPRSAVKSIQALPLIETGAADALGFGNRELAISCASHDGEPEHAALASAMLAKVGLDVSALECGTHWPSSQKATIDLARAGGEPNALHNNCSGKHSGFLCTCRHAGIEIQGYSAYGHPFQEMVRETMQAVTGAAHEADACGTDGCSIPTYAVPLSSLAHGFAKMVTGNGLAPIRAKAASRLMAACMAEPFMVAGTDSADTALMRLAPGRLFVKVGAEGVYCAAVPELGLGIALKCDDGSFRAAEVMVAAVLERLLKTDTALSESLIRQANPVIRSRRGVVVGGLRPTAALAS
jgi:L-asparaginase II